MKTWGEIYHKWLRKRYDNGYAAWLADKYVQRMKRQLKGEPAVQLNLAGGKNDDTD